MERTQRDYLGWLQHCYAPCPSRNQRSKHSRRLRTQILLQLNKGPVWGFPWSHPRWVVPKELHSQLHHKKKKKRKREISKHLTKPTSKGLTWIELKKDEKVEEKTQRRRHFHWFLYQYRAGSPPTNGAVNDNLGKETQHVSACGPNNTKALILLCGEAAHKHNHSNARSAEFQEIGRRNRPLQPWKHEGLRNCPCESQKRNKKKDPFLSYS